MTAPAQSFAPDDWLFPAAAGKNILYTPQDPDWLSEPLCILRAQIEAFAATPDDVRARVGRGAIKKESLTVGRVGIRCVHCAHIPLEDRVRGAVSYPKSVRIMHQAVRNFQRYHFLACQHTPESAKERFRAFGRKSAQSKKDSNEYWVKCCERMGLVDLDGGEGIRYVVPENSGSANIAAGDAETLPSSSAPEEEQKKPAATEAITGHVEADDNATETMITGHVEADNDAPVRVAVEVADVVTSGVDDLSSALEGARNITLPPAASAAETVVTSGVDGMSSTLEHATNITAPPPAAASPMETDQDKVLRSVRLAHGKSEKVKECHAAGIPCYDGSGNCGGLAFSSVDGSLRISLDGIRSDLVSLGIDLYKSFAGVYPFETGAIHTNGSEQTVASSVTEQIPARKRERQRASGSYVPLRDLGLPVSLCILVSSLLGARDDDAVDRFRNATDVTEDLRLMTVDPQRYLFGGAHSESPVTGRMEFPPGRLYGREKDVAEMTRAFSRVVVFGGAREVVLISGYPGTGKTALVEQLRKPLVEGEGHFISGKFYEMGQVQPMSIIFAAFDNYCKDLLRGDEVILALVRRAIRDALGPNVGVLTDLMPNLAYVMRDSVSSPLHIDGMEAMNRLLFYFRAFVRAIAGPSHPVILFLDDLQWADKSSLGLISTLVSDAETNSLLFAGCYRNNEVGPDHPLNAEIANISSVGVNVLNINLENIDRESVNALISDTLCLSPRLTRPLANIVHAKTSGNPLFAVQFLRSLCDEDMLRYSASSRRWEWDMEAIQSKDIADNVVDLMTKKMLTLDSGVQELLKVASCLGSQSEASTLKLLCSNGDDDGSGILPLFDLMINEGYLSRVGTCYKFSHDQIQQAAYSLIPEGSKDALHMHIGKVLWKKTTEKELNRIVFIVVDQLHRGSNLISDHDEKVEIARLCLLAGEKAFKSFAFLQASICLLQGSTLLEESDWDDNYDLSLQLFTRCGEAQYASGNLDGAAIALAPIGTHGRCLGDKLRAYYTLLNCMGAQGKQLDAIKAGLSVLMQLGQEYPSEPSQNDVMNEFGKTQAMLQGTTTGGILEQDELQDPKKIATMKLQNILIRYAYQANQELMSLLTFSTVQMSLHYGVCQESALAFAVLGAMLNAFGDFDHGYQYGKLALSLLKRFDVKEYLPHVYAVVYDAVVIFKEPLQAGLPSLRYAYTLGLSTGNVEWAMTNANIYSVFAIQCGSRLEPLAEEVKAYVQQMKEYQHHMLALTLPCFQAILNLMGGTQDPSNLTGEAMDQDELLNTSLETQQFHVVCIVCIMRMWLAYLFGRYDVAAEMVESCRSIPRLSPGGTMISETFYTGLIAVVTARKEYSSEWRSIADEALGKLKVWAGQSAWNFQHKVDLLRAEIAYCLDGDLDGAAKAYDDAIRLSGEHGFFHEQALACERAGIFHSETSNVIVAEEYLQRARNLYVQWGAKRKAEELFAPRIIA